MNYRYSIQDESRTTGEKQWSGVFNDIEKAKRWYRFYGKNHEKERGITLELIEFEQAKKRFNKKELK